MKNAKSLLGLLRLIRHPAFELGDIGLLGPEVISTIREQINIQRASIWACEDSYDQLKDFRPIDKSPHSIASAVAQAFSSLWQKVIGGKNYYLCGAEFNKAINSELQIAKYVESEHITALLCIPIMIHDEVFGILHLEDTKPRNSWTEEEIAFCELLTALISIAIRSDEFNQAQSQILKYAQKTEQDQREIEHQARELEARSLELAKARDTAEAATRTKSQFLANMSHEIRTPMNGILGMTELALGTEINSVQREYLETIQFSGQSLLTIINDILDFSKIEAGKMTVSPTSVEIRKLLTRVVAIFSPRINEKHLEVLINVEDSVPEWILIDDTRVSQIIVNLLGNAVKFTPEGGGIFIQVFASPDPVLPNIILHIVVSDSGVGISKETLSRLFEPFTQADASTTRRYGGTGLGLVISRRLAELMGGDISVISKPGKGSAFNLSVKTSTCEPIEKVGTTGSNSMASSNCDGSPDLTGVQILLAEDNLVNQKLAVRLLEKWGCSIVLASTGEQAVELYKKQDATKPFELILMDCQMPVLDGYQATQAIRALERDSATHIPIIAMTAHAMEGDREKCINEGMDDYVSKPLDITKLKKLLYHWAKT